MRFSNFIHELHRDKVVCLYNALNMHTFFMSQDEYIDLKKAISQGETDDSSQMKEMLKYFFVVDDDFDEDSHIERIIKRVFTGVNIRVMVLHLSDFCNLKCRYCFIEGNIGKNYERKLMSKEVVKCAIDWFIQILRDYQGVASPSIVFYGGEPLTNWDTLKYALEYLHDKKEGINTVLITNGTLINKDIAETLKKHNVYVSVSLDGDEECTNVNRVYQDGRGAFADTIRGIETLRVAGVEPSVSCVLAKENVYRAPMIMKYFAENLGIKALGFNHVSIVPNQNYYDIQYEQEFAQALINVQEEIQAKYPDIFERRMNHKINCFNKRLLLRADCTGCGEQVSISPLGEVGICQGYMGTRKTFNNTIFNKDYSPKNDPVFIEWSNRSPLNMEECRKCIALATCGGGCPRNADVLTGSIWNPDKAFCHFAKLAQEWMIWKSYS